MRSARAVRPARPRLARLVLRTALALWIGAPASCADEPPDRSHQQPMTDSLREHLWPSSAGGRGSAGRVGATRPPPPVRMPSILYGTAWKRCAVSSPLCLSLLRRRSRRLAQSSSWPRPNCPNSSPPNASKERTRRLNPNQSRTSSWKHCGNVANTDSAVVCGRRRRVGGCTFMSATLNAIFRQLVPRERYQYACAMSHRNGRWLRAGEVML